MKAIVYLHHGGPEVLRPKTVAKPTPEADELLVRVYATTVNRIDINQRRGNHLNNENSPEVLGYEIAGEVVAKGKNASRYQKGDRVFGLVNGGGYAEFCNIDEGLAMPIPEHWSYEYAAAIPKNFITADETLFTQGNLKRNETVLIHAGGSGVGTASIQLAHHIGAKIFITAGTDEKINRALEIGAHTGINYHTHDFAYHIQTLTDNQGVDVIQDIIGGKYLVRNVSCLKENGRLILVSLLDGNKGDLNLTNILLRKLQIKGSSFETMSLDDKRECVKRFEERWLPTLKQGHLKPIIDYVFPWEMIQEAHKHVESNRNFGKVVLKIR
jgi:putative PIG3 family NAD(P)H quinone oxidoreductase